MAASAAGDDVSALIGRILDAAEEGGVVATGIRTQEGAAFLKRAGALGLPIENMVEDRCSSCGTLIGIGDPSFHIGICERCVARAARVATA